MILDTLFFYKLLRKKTKHCRLIWNTVLTLIILGDSCIGYSKPLWLWNVFPLLPREAVSPAITFVAWHLSAMLCTFIVTKYAKLSLLVSFLPFLCPLKQLVVACKKIGHTNCLLYSKSILYPTAVFVCLRVHTTTFCFNAERSIALKAFSVPS